MRLQNDAKATSSEEAGWTVTRGAGRGAELWIRGPGNELRGGTFVDIVARYGTITIRIQTIDTLADFLTPTAREAAAAARIRAASPNQTLILIPKWPL